MFIAKLKLKLQHFTFLRVNVGQQRRHSNYEDINISVANATNFKNVEISSTSAICFTVKIFIENSPYH